MQFCPITISQMSPDVCICPATSQQSLSNCHNIPRTIKKTFSALIFKQILRTLTVIETSQLCGFDCLRLLSVLTSAFRLFPWFSHYTNHRPSGLWDIHLGKCNTLFVADMRLTELILDQLYWLEINRHVMADVEVFDGWRYLTFILSVYASPMQSLFY